MALLARPERFAAAVPICGGDRFIGVTPQEFALTFAGFPLWSMPLALLSAEPSLRIREAVNRRHTRNRPYPRVPGRWSGTGTARRTR